MATQPKLFIQMSGAPGAGKSTFSRLIAPSIGAVVIDHDVLRSSLLESSVPFAEAAAQAYRLQWTLADSLMSQGFSVIVDSPFYFPECQVQDIDQLDQRLRSRDALPSQRTGVDRPPSAAAGSTNVQDSYALFKKWVGHPCRPEKNALVVDATEDPETLRNAILERVLRKIQ